MIQMKICSKCKENKSHNEFYKDKDSKDGFRSSCKSCNSTMCKKYYKDNQSTRLDYASQYRSENPEKVKLATQLWKLNNKDYAWDWIDIYKDLMEMHNGLKFNWDFYLLLSKVLKH